MPDYILDNAAAEAEQRFGALEALFDPVTIRHLEPFVVPGAHCLEVGGGSGSIARWMSGRVGANGRVLVTDLNTRFLDDINAANVEVRQHNILIDPLDDDAFDVAHTRLVLVHLPERTRAIERMLAALKAGGHIVLQEFDVVSTIPNPATFPGETLLKLMVVFPEVMLSRGVNNRFGRELFPLLVSMGLDDVVAEGHTTMFRGGSAGARLMRANFEQLHDAIIATRRITEEEFQQDLLRLDDPTTIWPSQILSAECPRPQAMIRTPTAITADEARRIAVAAQGLALTPDRPKTVAGVLNRTGAVQLDTISVLARSHELVAYARLGAVGRAAVEDAYWSHPASAFEYYAHAACVLPLDVWPSFAFRRGQLGRGVWPQLTKTNILEEVRARLKDGPVTATDLGGARQTAGWWNWSDAKRALETLYARGEAVCTMRRNWKRVYDLPERVIPPHLLKTEERTPEECYRDLVQIAAKALGVATRRDIAEYFYLLPLYLGRKLERARLLDEALAESNLTPVEVEGWDEPAYADPAALEKRPAADSRTTLLSPFDSLVWDRKRTQRIFGYALSLEAYKPKETRIHGYFTMPLLADNRIIGHVDPAREGRTLIARNAHLHDPTEIEALAAALKEAATWVNCEAIQIDRATPRAIAPPLKRALR